MYFTYPIFIFLKIFLTWTICKVFIESVTMLLLLFMFWVFSCEACGVLGLSRWLRGKRICLPVQETQETWVQSLGWEDPLEEEMATHSSFLAWKIPWTEEPGGLQFVRSQRVGHDLATKPHSSSRLLFSFS